ncbi:MAG TPA: hypothetical protein VN285_12785 [Candidatus Deferrimicrobium sp.]|nr:hypothetical protein [Candidatus Deferrimicrobium sp.]
MATRTGFYDPITAELRAGNSAAAAQLLEKAREDNQYAEKDRFLYFIDAGMLNHYADSHEVSTSKLHLAEAAAEELFTKSVSRAATSLLLNDNVLEYAGEDYEILYTNLIKALNYIAQNRFEDAFVEVRRVNLKLEQLEQKYADAASQLQRGSPEDTGRVELEYTLDKVRFHNDAFARYLSMHMYAAEGKMDDARIDYDFLRQAFQTQAHIYDFSMPNVKYRSDSGVILSVVALVGLAPVKEALNLRIRTDKQLGIVQVLYDDPQHEGAQYGHLPINVKEDYYFKFAIPTLQPRPSQVQEIRVLVNGEPVGSLQLLEGVGKVAQETFAAKKSLIYLRSVARAVAKGLAAHKLKEKVDTGGLGGWLKKAAIDVGTDLIENADLRCSQFLPGMIYVGDFELEPGTYDITLEFSGSDGSLVGSAINSSYQIREAGWNLVEECLIK